jgi:hypothetical protein
VNDSVHHLRQAWVWAWLLPLAGLIGMQFWFPRWGSASVGDSYSTHLAGKKLIFLLLDEYGTVVRQHQDLRECRNWAGNLLCVLGPARRPTAAEWAGMLSWVSAGGTLVYAVPRDDPALTIAAMGLTVDTTTSPIDFAGTATAAMAPEGVLPARELSWHSAARVKGDHARVLLQVERLPQVVEQKYGSGRVILAASDWVFTNEGAADRDNASVALWLITDGVQNRYVEIEESLNETGTPKVVELLLDPALRPLTLQAGVVLLLALWNGVRRFGPLLPPTVGVRRDLADHSRALGGLYYRARGGSVLVRGLLELLRHELRLSADDRRNEQVLSSLAERSRWKRADVERTLRFAEAVAAEKEASTRVAARAIRGLVELRAALLRPRRAQEEPAIDDVWVED